MALDKCCRGRRGERWGAGRRPRVSGRLGALLSLMFLALAACQSGGSTTGGSPGSTGGTGPGVTSGPSGVAAAPDKNWDTYGGNISNWRHSSLTQINTANVKDLKGAWTFHANYGNKASSFESTPIVVDGVMYVTSGRDDVWALNAKNGSPAWEYHPNIDTDKQPLCCGVVNRGVAVGDGKVFLGQVDGKLVALDQKTGGKLWEVMVGDPSKGFSETMAPLYRDGLVYIGMSGAEYETRGHVTAYNSKDGSMAWRWYTIPGPGEPGSDTWPKGDAYLHGGGSMWMTPALDPQLGLLYLAVGNPGPDLDGGVRAGDNLYTESLVALNAKTGKHVWHFQEIHHDIWDYDAVSPVVLFDGLVNGQQVRALAEAGKTGWVYVLDRATGKPQVPVPEKSVPQDQRQKTAKTQPYPQGDSFVPQCPTNPVSQYPKGCIFTPFEETPILIAPGANGGNEWSPIAFSPQTQYVYVPGLVQPQIFTFNPSAIQEGSLKLGSGFVSPPGQETSGTFTAIDTRTNKIAWQKPMTNMMIGGTMSTAGGLVFTGEGDGTFRAFDAKSGSDLWKFQTGAGANAAPMTYEVDGDQYVAVAAGGNFQLDYPRGDTLWVFSLKGTMGEASAPPQPPTKSEQAPLGPPVVTDKVEIVNFKFIPDNITVKVGTTITATNTGAFPHTWSDLKGSWDTGVLQTGQSKAITFDKPGVYDFYCKPHPWMVGKLTVTQ